MRTRRDIPTQGKQLDQRSKTTNCRRTDPAEPCSRESGGTSEHDEGRLDPPGPPQREGEQQGCNGDFKKQLCHRKSQKGRLSPQLTGSQVGQSTGAIVMRLSFQRRLASAPPLCIHAYSCAILERARPMYHVKQSETPLSYVLCAAQAVQSVLIQDYH